MSKCIKTGLWVLLADYNLIYRTDLHTVGGSIILIADLSDVGIEVSSGTPKPDLTVLAGSDYYYNSCVLLFNLFSCTIIPELQKHFETWEPELAQYTRCRVR